MLRRNRLRELLQAGKPSVGTHILSAWPTITELVGQTGTWDYIEFVAEYTPWTMHDLDNLGRAIELFPDFTGMIKIEQDTRGHLAMRALGSGIQNLLFADVRTPAEALQCVRAVRAEHPEHGGLHGVGMRRDVRTVLHLHPALAPYKACVVPLFRNKPDLVNLARRVYEELRRRWMITYDSGSNIGKLYRRQDEIGTPYCITIDFQSLDDQRVTIRDRDSMDQSQFGRVPIEELRTWLDAHLDY